MIKILVTGGAGYVGSILVGQLLERGYKVKVMDILRKGGLGLISYFNNPNLEFIKSDIRNSSAIEEIIRDVDVIIHLAAVVGQPACDNDPWAAKQINLEGTKNIIAKRSKQQLIIFTSTLSNYGRVVGKICTEEMKPRPLTLYAKTKVEAERYLFEAGNIIILRPATAFGISPQMRLDLLFNDFVYRAITIGKLELFESDFIRAFIHVRDFGNGLIFSIENADKMLDKIFNLGDESLNLTKKNLAEHIKQQVDFTLCISDNGSDPDKRNYKVDFSRIKALGYRTHISIDQGIKELIRVMPILKIHNHFSNPSYY